jgi:osmotically-inducible protein OsmY
VAGCSKKTSGEVAARPAAALAGAAGSTESLKDPDITHAIEVAFGRDPGVDAKNLHVSTTNGIVELTGSADNILTDRRAVRLAETVKGVRAVSDRIQINVKARPDADVQRDVKEALSSNAATDSFPIEVAVRAGAVTLSGTLHSHVEQTVAERVAEGVKGVSALHDELKIADVAARPDREILADVQSRFRWDQRLNDGLLQPAVEDGKVTLSGLVGSAAEKRRAERQAWVRGVKSVDASAVKVEWWAKRQDLLRNKLGKHTDAEIAKAIRDAAALDPRVQTAGLEVDVAGGVAHLRGNVASVQAKSAAESLARDTLGVVDVKNELEIEPQKPVSDQTVEKRVTSALDADPALGSFRLKANTKDGIVTLTGSVQTSFERAEATALAAGIRGVRRIQNQLTVERPEVAYIYSFYLDPYEPFIETLHYAPASSAESDPEIARQIKADLAFSPFLDEGRMNVSVNHGTATLTGDVESYGEKAIATEDAFAGGAVAVENRLRVAPPGG